MIRAPQALCLLLPGALTALASCGPMALPDAERSCIADAQLAQHPRGTVALGLGSGGRSAAGFGIDISSDYLLGRDPDAVYASCVQSRAGLPPTQPFSSLPESRM
ncbi:hypothetical protein GC209_04030 [bacterium]|nr:hypothetical protein [bacterium]